MSPLAVVPVYSGEMESATLVGLRDAPDADAFMESFCAAPRALRSPELAKLAPPAPYWRQFLDSKDASAESWIALRGERCLGRIGAAISPTRPGVGYVGFFENALLEPGHDRTAKDLLEAACAWLKARGVSQVYGPVDRNTWYSYRYTVASTPGPDGYDEPLFAWEPPCVPPYLEAFRAAGFVDAEHYHSIAFRRVAGVSAIQASADVSKPGYEMASSAGISFRPLGRAKELESSLALLFELASEGFRENFLFEPITVEQFSRLYVPLVGSLDYADFSHMALDESGAPAAFLIAYHDRGYLVVKTLAVRADHRKRGAGHALMHLAFKAAAARGIGLGISALVRQGNTGTEALETRHMPDARSWRRDYVLLERKIDASD